MLHGLLRGVRWDLVKPLRLTALLRVVVLQVQVGVDLVLQRSKRPVVDSVMVRLIGVL